MHYIAKTQHIKTSSVVTYIEVGKKHKLQMELLSITLKTSTIEGCCVLFKNGGANVKCSWRNECSVVPS